MSPPFAAPLTSAPLRIDAIELRLLRLDLVEPFETSFGRVRSRLIVLVKLEAEGLEGWGEIVAGEEPLYSYETVGTAVHVVRDYFRARDPAGAARGPVRVRGAARALPGSPDGPRRPGARLRRPDREGEG